MEPSPLDILGSGGPVAANLEAEGLAFEERPEQLAMSKAVWDAMESRSMLLAEAGTGVGKSFAYLVPAILRCIMRGEKVVVATNTISLQEQLIRKDVPMLEATLDRWGADGAICPLRPVLVKGRGNYMSIRRLKLASERAEKLLGDEASLRSLGQIADWAYDTADGTKATLPVLERESVWEHAQSDADNCMGRSCPYHADCFYQKVRRQIEGGNLFICNHALFFADLALRTSGGAASGILPEYHHVILDEAHCVEDVASEHLGVSVSLGRVRHLVRTLYDLRRRKGYLEQLRVHVGDHDLLDGAIQMALEVGHEAERYFGEWRDLVRSGRLGGGGRIGEARLVHNTMAPQLARLAMRLNRVKDRIESEPDRFELQAYARRAAEIGEASEAFDRQDREGFVYWVDAPVSAQNRVTLSSSPVEVGPFLREHLYGDGRSIVFTSATLATSSSGGGGDPFGHVRERLGCAEADTIQLGSPFDHASQVELVIDTSVPNPGRGGGGGVGGAEAYHDILAERVVEHVLATDGGAFVLFTSFASLWKVADRVGSTFSSHGLTTLVQGRDGSREELLERFRSDERGVLLGAASFWQGVDVRGNCLRNVIITRLPFEPPDRPLTQARLELVEQRGGNPFMDDSLPRAVIRFKQGFGRLIRSSTDSGRVAVLDPRVVTARYGQIFLRALPEGVRVRSEDGEEYLTEHDSA